MNYVHAFMGQYVINNDIICIKLTVIVIVMYSCDLMGLTVQDYINNY